MTDNLKYPQLLFFLCVCMMTRRKNINKATAKSLYISRTESYFQDTEIDMLKIFFTKCKLFERGNTQKGLWAHLAALFLIFDYFLKKFSKCWICCFMKPHNISAYLDIFFIASKGGSKEKNSKSKKWAKWAHKPFCVSISPFNSVPAQMSCPNRNSSPHELCIMTLGNRRVTKHFGMFLYAWKKVFWL